MRVARNERRWRHPRFRDRACRRHIRRMWTKRAGPGRFGMAEETGRILNEVIRSAQSRQEGLGQAVGAYLSAANARWADRSLIATAHRLQIPVTVHVAIGTDIIHMHEDASGAAIGDASLRDFEYFTSCVARLSGGVYLNCGSAVVLPEVFLKAVALARNQDRAGWTDHRQHRLHADVSPADQRCDAPGGRQQREGNFPCGPSRGLDSVDCRGRHRERKLGRSEGPRSSWPLHGLG